MKTIHAIAAAAALILPVSSAMAETWTVYEGAKGETRGVWDITVRGASFTGNAAMLAPKGRSINYQVTGEAKGGKIILRRIAPSDRLGCTYMVDETREPTFSGSAICDGQSFPWRVSRKKT
jgi:hypothetical protein